MYIEREGEREREREGERGREREKEGERGRERERELCMEGVLSPIRLNTMLPYHHVVHLTHLVHHFTQEFMEHEIARRTETKLGGKWQCL